MENPFIRNWRTSSTTGKLLWHDGGDTRFINITSDNNEYAGQVVQTIICEGDAIGAVIVLSKDDKTRFGETEQKAAIIAANFLGKQMES